VKRFNFILFLLLLLLCAECNAQTIDIDLTDRDLALEVYCHRSSRLAEQAIFLNGHFLGFGVTGLENSTRLIKGTSPGDSFVWSYDLNKMSSPKFPSENNREMLVSSQWKELVRTVELKGMRISSSEDEAISVDGLHWLKCKIDQSCAPQSITKKVLISEDSRQVQGVEVLSWSAIDPTHDEFRLRQFLSECQSNDEIEVKFESRNRKEDFLNDLRDIAYCCGRIFSPFERQRKIPIHLDLGNELMDFARSILYVEVTNIMQDLEEDSSFYWLNGTFVGVGKDGIQKIRHEIDSAREGSAIVLPEFEARIREEFKKVSTPPALERSLDELRSVARERKHEVLGNRVSVMTRLRQSILGWKPSNVVTYKQHFEMYYKYASIWKFKIKEELDHSLDWSGYDATFEKPRKSENTAAILLDGIEQGIGFHGFMCAVKAIEKFPDGSTLGIAVCASDKPPFKTPRFCEEFPHVEVFGVEPYVDMLPIVFDVASKKNITIFLFQKAD
jgi:hypothetical protein